MALETHMSGRTIGLADLWLHGLRGVAADT
jgi:hypothetical protein